MKFSYNRIEKQPNHSQKQQQFHPTSLTHIGSLLRLRLLLLFLFFFFPSQACFTLALSTGSSVSIPDHLVNIPPRLARYASLEQCKGDLELNSVGLMVQWLIKHGGFIHPRLDVVLTNGIRGFGVPHEDDACEEEEDAGQCFDQQRGILAEDIVVHVPQNLWLTEPRAKAWLQNELLSAADWQILTRELHNPETLLASKIASKQASAASEEEEESQDNNLGVHMVLVLALERHRMMMMKKMKKKQKHKQDGNDVLKSSPWAEYAQALPTYCPEMLCADISEMEAALALVNDDLSVAGIDRVRQLHHILADIFRAVSLVPALSGVDINSIAWGHAMFASRHWGYTPTSTQIDADSSLPEVCAPHVRANCPILVPVADMFNHDPFTGVSFDPRSGTIPSLKGSRAQVAPGEQMFITYGNKSNMLLWHLYGFVPSTAQGDNPSDSYPLQISWAPNHQASPLNAARMALMSSSHGLSQWTATSSHADARFTFRSSSAGAVQSIVLDQQLRLHRPPVHAMALMRMVHANGKELQRMGQDPEFLRDVSNGSAHLSPQNEVLALNSFLHALRSHRPNAWGSDGMTSGSAHEDAQLLNTGTHLTHMQRNAIEIRRRHKLIVAAVERWAAAELTAFAPSDHPVVPH